MRRASAPAMEANHHFPLPNDVTDDDNDDDDDNQEDDDNLDDDDDADDSYDDYGCGADYDYDERGEDGKGNDTMMMMMIVMMMLWQLWS